ncbi:MAG: hypothetical protein KDK40_04540, partial [Chlamydiia bacterium]|nr:hypothetical protein [Chlamydiia bacterium]
MIALYLEINPKNCDERRLWVDKTYTIASMIDEMSLEDLKSLSHLLFAKFGIANQKERNTLTVKWFWILSEKVFDSALSNATEAHESNVAIVN